MDVPVSKNTSEKPAEGGDKNRGEVGPLERFEVENADLEKKARTTITKLDREADKFLLSGDVKKAISSLEESIQIHDQAALPTDRLYVNKTLVLAKLLEETKPAQETKADRYKDKAVDALMSHRTLGSDLDAMNILAKQASHEPANRAQLDSHMRRLGKIVEIIDRSENGKALCEPLLLERCADKLIKCEKSLLYKEQCELLKSLGEKVRPDPDLIRLPRKTAELAEKLYSRADEMSGKDEVSEQLKDLRKLLERKKLQPHKWFED